MFSNKNLTTFFHWISLSICLCILIANLSGCSGSNISKSGQYTKLFNGQDLSGWVGDKKGYLVENGTLVCSKSGKKLYTEKEYCDFEFSFEFKLTAGANNGLGIRTPQGVDPAYKGMEIQILDNSSKGYQNLKSYQFHGSIYGVFPAKRGYLNPVGHWNKQKVIANGDQITVILNGTKIIDANIKDASKNGTIDNKAHPGLDRKCGYIGFLGHGKRVEFKNILIKKLNK